MTNAYKMYLQGDKYRVIDDKEFISIAKDKVFHDTALQKQYSNREINKLAALKIFNHLGRKILPVNAMLIQIKDNSEPILKTIEKMEEDIEKFVFEHIKEDNEDTAAYLNGSKEAMIKILEKDLEYEVVEENERTLEDFIEKEVFVTTKISYNAHDIKITLTSEKFLCNFNEKKIYKYQSTMIDQDGYQFHFRKNELFATKDDAIIQSKKLVDEHYNLPIRNSKIQKIIVRTDADNTIIVFWPDVVTDSDYIMANDIIGKSDLAGDTKTSLLFFNECKDAKPSQVILAKNVIEKCMNLQTVN
ncbi:MAG: hypothetical protein WA945_04505, partial [Arcobacteraceae bacterium]